MHLQHEHRGTLWACAPSSTISSQARISFYAMLVFTLLATFALPLFFVQALGASSPQVRGVFKLTRAHAVTPLRRQISVVSGYDSLESCVASLGHTRCPR